MNKAGKINVRDDEATVAAFRKAAAKNGETVSQIIRRYVRRYISRSK